MTKICSSCNLEKETSFFFNDKRHKSGVRYVCKACDKDACNKYRLENKEKIEKSRHRYRQSEVGKSVEKAYNKRYKIEKYGISLEEHTNILITQNYKCTICGIKLTNETQSGMHIDHCHKTNKVRGILCGLCNVGLGAFRDSPTFLIAAANYLKMSGVTEELEETGP